MIDLKSRRELSEGRRSSPALFGIRNRSAADGDGGYAMLIIILSVFVMSMVGLVSLIVVASAINNAQNTRPANLAMSLAEQGVSAAYAYLADAGNQIPYPDGSTVTKSMYEGAGDFTAEITRDNAQTTQDFTITSTGTYTNDGITYTRKVQQEIEFPRGSDAYKPFDFLFFTQDGNINIDFRTSWNVSMFNASDYRFYGPMYAGNSSGVANRGNIYIRMQVPTVAAGFVGQRLRFYGQLLAERDITMINDQRDAFILFAIADYRLEQHAWGLPTLEDFGNNVVANRNVNLTCHGKFAFRLIPPEFGNLAAWLDIRNSVWSGPDGSINTSPHTAGLHVIEEEWLPWPLPNIKYTDLRMGGRQETANRITRLSLPEANFDLYRTWAQMQDANKPPGDPNTHYYNPPGGTQNLTIMNFASWFALENSYLYVIFVEGNANVTNVSIADSCQFTLVATGNIRGTGGMNFGNASEVHYICRGTFSKDSGFSIEIFENNTELVYAESGITYDLNEFMWQDKRLNAQFAVRNEGANINITCNENLSLIGASYVGVTFKRPMIPVDAFRPEVVIKTWKEIQ